MSRRIAIVGAGISGLVCAHLLEEGHDITVFEANADAGGHTAGEAWDFDATLALSRRELSPWPLLRYPFMTLRVVAGIYAHASRLALRGAPYHPHAKR